MPGSSDRPAGDDSPTEYRAPSSGSVRSDARFTPGKILADRYRIIAPLGRGGMGEVYRAEDVKLGQQVALKFLPSASFADPARVERLYQEVRLGRQVSHPNVCRLYDIGEWEGNHFLTMEYVDGEDLASLIRRIGRLPEQKGFEIARDICAGIAAAHALGIVHRDLKPANVMIDGRGTARITDFGLAALAENASGHGEAAGTPAYMAPEQLSSGAATQKSDLYALGLILYEMFTGRRLFSGSTINEILAQHSASRSHLSSDTRALDPAVQRVIVRCVEEDPNARPSSIHAVIAALPGGDPLQAAIDAGETPSPQMVAAGGAVGELEPSMALAAIGAVVVVIAAAVFFYGRATLVGQIAPQKSGEVLEDRAREIQRMAWPDAKFADSAAIMLWNDDFFEWMKADPARGHRNLRDVSPGVLQYLLRQSSTPMIPHDEEERVLPNDPPRDAHGMSEVWLDQNGRLTMLRLNPPPKRTDVAQQPDWNAFFQAAGLDPRYFSARKPLWNLPVDYEARWAWSGIDPKQPGIPIHVEAAAAAGRPVFFWVSGPWQQTVPELDPGISSVTMFRNVTWTSVMVLALVAAIVLARLNLRRGRGDRRGALRLAAFMFTVMFAGRVIRLHHVTSPAQEVDLVLRAAAYALFSAALAWLLYIALEPFIRRTEPRALVSSTRLLAGRFRDPMVGRDILLGILAGISVALLRMLTVVAPTWAGRPALTPLRDWVSPLAEARHIAWAITFAIRDGVQVALMLGFLFFLIASVSRRRSVGLAAIFLVIAMAVNARGDNLLLETAGGALIATIAVLVLSRLGILSLGILVFADDMIMSMPLTLDPSSWYFGRSAFALVLLAAMAAWGFTVAMGEKSLFPRLAPERG